MHNQCNAITKKIQPSKAEAYMTKARTLEDTVPSLHRSWKITPIQVRTSLSMLRGRMFLLNEARAQHMLKRLRMADTWCTSLRL